MPLYFVKVQREGVQRHFGPTTESYATRLLERAQEQGYSGEVQSMDPPLALASELNRPGPLKIMPQPKEAKT